MLAWPSQGLQLWLHITDAAVCDNAYSLISSKVPRTYCLRPSGTMLSGSMYMSKSARQKLVLGSEMLTLASAKSVYPGGKRPPVRLPSSARKAPQSLLCVMSCIISHYCSEGCSTGENRHLHLTWAMSLEM